MRHGIWLTVFILAIGACGDAYAQNAGAPLRLAPGDSPPPASGKVPRNWKILTGRPDPLTDKVTRMAMNRPKATPVVNGKSIPTALMMNCNPAPKLSPGPILVVSFQSLTGVGHFKTFGARYRLDDGPVHDFTAETILGKDHSRTFALPLSTRLDPGVEIAVSKRLRLGVNFQSAGTVFLDFDVSGSQQVLAALGCPSGVAR
jgi:hypothetical protein